MPAILTIASLDLERELVPLMQDQRLGLMVWTPLAGGLLSGKYTQDAKGPEGARRTAFDFPVADRHGVTVAQVALARLPRLQAG